MKEAELKLQISEYLQIGVNQGKWYADRLNSGEVIIVQGKSRRRVKLCREGTADFIIIRGISIEATFSGLSLAVSQIIFLEAKGDKGRSRPEQGAFKILVEAQGAEYFIVRGLQEVIDILA